VRQNAGLYKIVYRTNQPLQVTMTLPSKTGVTAKLTRSLRIGRIFIAFGGIMVLAGCSEPTVTPIASEPDLVTIKLAQAADKASQALDSIANIEQQRSPAIAKVDSVAAGAPPSLAQPITIRWSGPIEQITKTLADRAGLQFRVTGLASPAPITVSLDVYQQPLINVLQNIGLQAGQRADVAVDARAGVVEIRYAPIDKP
jgi:defect-in-organelle-trafficking protein DotD